MADGARKAATSDGAAFSLSENEKRLHHPARGAHFAVIFVRYDKVYRRETDEDVDDHRESHAAEYHVDKIVAKGNEEPVQTSDDEEDEGDHV